MHTKSALYNLRLKPIFFPSFDALFLFIIFRFDENEDIENPSFIAYFFSRGIVHWCWYFFFFFFWFLKMFISWTNLLRTLTLSVSVDFFSMRLAFFDGNNVHLFTHKNVKNNKHIQWERVLSERKRMRKGRLNVNIGKNPPYKHNYRCRIHDTLSDWIKLSDQQNHKIWTETKENREKKQHPLHSTTTRTLEKDEKARK